MVFRRCGSDDAGKKPGEKERKRQRVWRPLAGKNRREKKLDALVTKKTVFGCYVHSVFRYLRPNRSLTALWGSGRQRSSIFFFWLARAAICRRRKQELPLPLSSFGMVWWCWGSHAADAQGIGKVEVEGGGWGAADGSRSVYPERARLGRHLHHHPTCPLP